MKQATLGCLLAATLASAALALTLDQPVTPAHVRQHSQDSAMKVAKGKAGPIDFTLQHHVATPRYHVAHLELYHEGRLLATSDTPLYGRKRGNTFHFSIAAEDIGESRFSLSDSGLSGSGEVAVPVVGTIVHQFRLADFVPKHLLQPAAAGVSTPGRGTQRFESRQGRLRARVLNRSEQSHAISIPQNHRKDRCSRRLRAADQTARTPRVPSDGRKQASDSSLGCRAERVRVPARDERALR